MNISLQNSLFHCKIFEKQKFSYPTFYSDNSRLFSSVLAASFVGHCIAPHTVMVHFFATMFKGMRSVWVSYFSLSLVNVYCRVK
jgi:hypothetical protein